LTAPSDHMSGLTQARLKELLHYDPETGIFTWLVGRPNGVSAGRRAGSLNRKGYLIIKVDNRPYKAARLAHLYMTGEFPAALMDHESRIRSDNRWKNLRPASNSQNCANRLVENKTGHKGVVYRKSRHRFEAYLKKDGSRRFLGCFKTSAEAGVAYAAAAVQAFDSYARSA